ncbi:lysophospholipid acyltransferase family protein [Pararcticibacter amylolyticus]|uniref:Glycerol acyltransferase n=1 Tax=Pararcticibacter amylolyticus TaxID=2173175 RepID=A0A2U2PEX7_9SPHI|nr:lysophospholipid acyltransferase family protein [Pararcticibacter amylolyticus]PWG79679.1 glycerol acyltransferase [Pararcticibacter amylolyticus]
MFSHLVRNFFSWYIGRIISRDFRELSFNQASFDPERAVLLLANHFSWWDGFFMYELNRRYFRKKFHVMVDEENYRKVWFLKYLGAFPVKKQSKSLLHSLEYAGKLLNDQNNLVLVFPQGRLYSSHTREIIFEKGLINLINSSDKRFQYVFAASFIDYFENRKPSVRCYLAKWEGEEFTSLQLIKSSYNKHYETSRQTQNRIIV